MVIIQTKNLTKKFKDLVAVDNVDLEIEEGECFGLLGPNGAGKTTLIRMIIAVSPPTKGDIRILGQPLAHNDRQIKAVMGVVPQHDNLDSDLTALQNLRTFARYFDIPGKEALRRSQELLKSFELGSKGKSRIRELSGGMKRRLLIARGLINNPRILILDEPTIGLDPQAKYLVWHKLTELKSQGITQLLCTQNMDEATNLCDRVAIMNQGKILNVNTPQKLVAEYAGKEVWEIEADSTAKHQIIEQLRSHRLDFEDTGYRIYVFHAETNGDIRELVNIMDKLKQRPATLEDVFFRLTGRSLAE